jgi:hypothetical protein
MCRAMSQTPLCHVPFTSNRGRVPDELIFTPNRRPHKTGRQHLKHSMQFCSVNNGSSVSLVARIEQPCSTTEEAMRVLEQLATAYEFQDGHIRPLASKTPPCEGAASDEVSSEGTLGEVPSGASAVAYLAWPLSSGALLSQSSRVVCVHIMRGGNA